MAPVGKTPWPATPVDGILDIGLSMDSGGASDAGAKLRAAMQAIANAAAVYERIVRSVGEHLDGEAADAALRSAARVSQSAMENATNAGTVGGQLDEVATILGSGRSAAEAGAAQVRAAAISTTSGASAMLDAYRARAVKAQLDAVMDSTYSNPMVGAHSLIDVTAVNDLDLPRPDATSALPRGSDEQGSPATAFGSSGVSDLHDAVDGSGVLPASQAPEAVQTSTSSPPDLAASAARLDSPGAVPGTPGSGPPAPLTTVPGPRGPEAGPSASGRGSPVATGLSGAMPGRTVGTTAPISPVPTSRVTGAGQPARPAPALPSPSSPRSTSRGIMPAAAPGSRAGTKADEHHRAAAYLRGRHHAESAIGPLPLVAPPVLGEWGTPQDANDGGSADRSDPR